MKRGYRVDFIQLYYFFFGVVLFSMIMESTYWYCDANGVVNQSMSLAVSGIRYISYMFFLIKFLLDKYSRKKMICLFLLIPIAISSVASGNIGILGLALMIFTGSNIEFDKLIKISMSLQIGIVIVCVFLSSIGMITDYIFAVGTKRPRHMLGFQWAGIPAFLYMYFVYEYTYIKGEKISNIEYIIGLAGAIFLYERTNTRAPFFLTIFMLTISWRFYDFISKSQFISKYRNIFIILPQIAAGISITLNWLYDKNNAVLYFLNLILSKRLYYANAALEKYGFSLFGQKIDFVGNTLYMRGKLINYVDNSYTYVLLTYGIIGLFIVLGAYSFLIKKMIKEKKNFLVVLILLVVIQCIVDNQIIKFSYNVFLFGVFSRINHSHENEKKKKRWLIKLKR